MNTKQIKQNLIKKFVNADGTLNKSTIAAFITLLLLLIQQILAIFGVKPSGDMQQVVGAINTVLSIAAACGFIEGTGEVETPGNSNGEAQNPQASQTGANAPTDKPSNN